MAYEDEAGLLTKILEEADIRTVIKQKVSPVFFNDVSCREVFSWIVARYQKYGRVPSLRLVSREFPEFEPVDVEEDLVELIEEVKSAKKHSDMVTALQDIRSTLKSEDAHEALNRLRTLSGQLTLTHSNTEDFNMAQASDEIWSEFSMAREGGGTMGIPYPWPYLNKITLGMHPEELIGIYARPKSMKTWVSLVIANHVHENSNRVPAFFSGEMPPQQIRKRLAALKARLPYSAFRSGLLTPKQLMRFRKTLAEMKEQPPFMICKVEGTGEAAIAEIRAKCEEYQVDVAICDGAYFWMEDDTYRSFRTITRGLKKGVAESLKIPVIMVTQANRASENEKSRGKSTAGIAFGDSLAQDCDQLLHIVREQQHQEARELLITMPAMREAEGGTFTINALPAEDFTQKHVFEDQREVLDDTDDGSSILDAKKSSKR